MKTRLAQIRAGQSTALHQSRESRHISSNGDYLGEIAVLRGDVNNARDNWYFSSTIKEQHFSSELAAGNASERHTVRAGDTLQSLAQLYYGNADYWYLIAAANGLSSVQGPAQQPAAGEAAAVAQQLVEGMTLDIPARASSFNSHQNFKPMDLATIIGDTTPTVPYLPPPPAAGCNAVAMVVMIAITAVVTGGVGMAMAGTLQGSLLGSAALASAASAGVGAFAGSVAGQLAGKAMGVVDSFSLKNAFSSGLTAAATAGFGSYLKGADWAKNADLVVKTGDKAGELSTYGKMAVAASGVGFSVAANKLAGNRASFQWRNVVSSAVTAGLMDRAQLHNITDPLERFSQSGGFLTDFTNGLAGAAIGYGVSKGLYNEGSWNFKNVATDAFGNALGNSIVSSMMPATPQQAEKKAKAAAQQAVLNGASPQEAKAIELQTYARESGGTIEAVAASGGKTGRGSFAYDSDDGFWLSNGSDRALIGYGASMNDVSDFLGNSAARDLGMQYASSRLVAKQASDAAFARGVARGEAMYAAGVRNREQIGVDFSGFNRNVDAYVRFREGQRAQFNDFYSGLNGVQRFAFNAGANLFGGLLNGGKAIGNLTAFTGIQGRQAFADSWGGLGNSVAGAASYAYNNPAGFAKSAIVDPITGAWDHYAGIYQADGFGAAAGALTGNLLSGVPFALAGLSKPVSFPKADLAPLHRRMLAEDALRDFGIPDYKLSSYLKGIDFNRAVELTTLSPNGIYNQYQPFGNNMGNFFTDVGGSPLQLGIRPDGKFVTSYSPKVEIPVLKSITADALVDWDGKPPYFSKGGEVQYMMPNTFKNLDYFKVLLHGD